MESYGIDNLGTVPLEISLPSGGIFENPFLGVSVVWAEHTKFFAN